MNNIINAEGFENMDKLKIQNATNFLDGMHWNHKSGSEKKTETDGGKETSYP